MFTYVNTYMHLYVQYDYLQRCEDSADVELRYRLKKNVYRVPPSFLLLDESVWYILFPAQKHGLNQPFCLHRRDKHTREQGVMVPQSASTHSPDPWLCGSLPRAQKNICLYHILCLTKSRHTT